MHKFSSFFPRFISDYFISKDGTNFSYKMNETTGEILPNIGRFNMTGYPSGYETWEVILISVIVVFIMATIIIGNLLVIVAIFSEYALQCVQNWFIASLAVADLMLGIVVMPFSLSQEVMGYWLFGSFWCQVSILTKYFEKMPKLQEKKRMIMVNIRLMILININSTMRKIIPVLSAFQAYSH